MTNGAVSVRTIQQLLYELGLTRTIAGEGVVVVKLEEGEEWVKIGLVVPKRRESANFLERDPNGFGRGRSRRSG